MGMIHFQNPNPQWGFNQAQEQPGLAWGEWEEVSPQETTPEELINQLEQIV